MDNKSKKTKDIIITVLFLTWFIASLISLIVMLAINPLYSLMVFGQYFLVFGFLIFSQKKHKMSGLPFVLVGTTCIVISFLMLYPNLLSIKLIWENVIVFITILFFFNSRSWFYIFTSLET